MECITDLSNWSGPFSLVAVCSPYKLAVVSSIPSQGARQIFPSTIIQSLTCDNCLHNILHMNLRTKNRGTFLNIIYLASERLVRVFEIN